MMMKRTMLVLICTVMMLSGCAKQSELSKLLKNIEEIEIPNEVEIVALGEASHGNKEFHEMKLDVFKHLVENEGFRAFALEADFGGSEVVNDYILHDVGSAREGLEAIGFYIYMTEEMIELIEWMHDYNETTSDKVYFYGYDMQSFNHSKKALLEYFGLVSPENAEAYEKELIALNDEGTIDPEFITGAKRKLEAMMLDLKTNEDLYVSLTNKKDYAYAIQYANSLLENIDLQTNPNSGNEIRDPYMAKKIEWISEFEKSEGRNRLFVCGHNGHIGKSEQLLKMKSMGVLLKETYEDKYFAIGTDFHESTFLSKDMANDQYDLKTFTVSNDSSELVNQLSECKVDVAYLDFSEAMKVESLKTLLTSSHLMGTMGATFMKSYEFLLFSYTTELVPSQTYDALIYVESATPTVMLPELE